MRVAMIAHTNAAWTPHYARHLMARGHEVLVVSFSPDPIEGVHVDYPSAPRWLALPGSLRFLAMVPHVRRSLRAFAPDVVLATYLSSNGMTAALAWKGPLVVSARGGDVLRQEGYLPGGSLLHGPMMRFVCRRADIVHSVSEEITESLVGCGVPAGKIECFPVGVDLSRFALRNPATGSQAPPRLICTRRQEPVYGNDIVIAALARLRDAGRAFHCTFVGGGPLLEDHHRRAVALGLEDRVTFVGEATHARMAALLREARIYLSASLSDGTSSSLLEAMACGLFPIVSRIRANLKWVRHGETGFLFAPGSAADLASAIEAALSNPALVEEAAPANRAIVERDGDLLVNMDRLESLLVRAAAGRGRRGA